MSIPRIRIARTARPARIKLPAIPRHTPPDAPRLALSITETARALGLSQASVERLIASGDLPSRLAGRRRLIGIDAIRNWLAGDNESEASHA